MNGIGYRQHLRAVVAASAAPYGYTLTIWTAGAIVTHAEGVPSSLDALLLLAGAVLAFGAAGIFAFGDTTVLSPTTRPPIHVWGGMHLPSVAVGRVHCHGDISTGRWCSVLAGGASRARS
jgi:hypothetical protein